MNSILSIYAFAGTTQALKAMGLPSFPAFRPLQWGFEPQVTFIEDYYGSLYFFDAIIRAEHSRTLRVTEHPVQDGANISDHSFQMPARLALEIGMSDAMDSYQAGQWQGPFAKSVNAYWKLLELQNDRLPLTVSTRLGTYVNMILEQINAPDDYKTKYGLKALVTFKQIITAQVPTTKVSVMPQQSQQTNVGEVQPTPPQGSFLNKAFESLGIE